MVYDRMIRRGDDMLNPGRNKEGRMDGELKTDAQKGRAWAYEGDMGSKALNVLREIMLGWWRRKLTRESNQVLSDIYMTSLMTIYYSILFYFSGGRCLLILFELNHIY